MRKAKSKEAGDMAHVWAGTTFTKPLPVRGAWTLPASGPVVWVDAASRLDVLDLARAHRETSEGAVRTQWVLAISPSMGAQVLLMVRYTRLARTEFALAFGPDHLEILTEIAATGSVSMVSREPRIADGVIECRGGVTVDIDRPGLVEVLGSILPTQSTGWWG
jgi:hypothetical protein